MDKNAQDSLDLKKIIKQAFLEFLSIVTSEIFGDHVDVRIQHENTNLWSL